MAPLPAACAPATIVALVFNIEYGGDGVDFRKTIEAIERSAPDVVAIEEAWGHIPRLARELRFAEHDRRHHVISRLPLLDSGDGEERVLFVEPSPGCVVALANVHLPSDPSLENLSLDEAIEVERRSRLSALEPTLESFRPLMERGVPVLLAGDFNTRSHLDDGLGWPTSRAVAAAGLRDAFRVAHPDPKTHPGSTWWAERPRVAGWNPSPDAPQRRIDRLYVGGAARVKNARIVGEEGREGVDIGAAPWPSDHRALLVTLELTPAPAPAILSAWPPMTVVGEAIRVRARGFPAGSRIALVSSVERSIELREASLADETFRTAALEPGTYEVRLLGPSGDVLRRSRVLVRAAGKEPDLSLQSETLEPGEPIELRFAGAPGNRWDWLGVYPEGADLQQEQPLLWRYTAARVQGTVLLDESAEGNGWPLPPGAYRLHLCEDDAYRSLASVGFRVQAR